MMVPNHWILGNILLEILYRALNANTRVVADTITAGKFLSLYWVLATKILDQIFNTNRGWKTQEEERESNTYVIRASSV